MKKKYVMLLAVTFMAVMTGCHKDGQEMQPAGSDRKIELKTSIKAEEPQADKAVRAPQLNDDGSGRFAAGDRITLLLATQSGSTTQFEYEVGGSTLYWKDVLHSTDGELVDFCGCYPVQNLSNGKFTFDLESAGEKDLLWVRKTDVSYGTDTPVDLVFTHAMHRLVVNYTSETENIEQISTVCTAKSTCDVDLINGTLNATSRKASFSKTGKTAVFLLAPQKTADVQLQITNDQYTKNYSLAELIDGHDNLESGMQLTVNLSVKNGSIVLEGSSISGWEDQGTVEGEIIL